MVLGRIIRSLGPGLIFGGLLIIGYSGLNYARTASAENDAESRVPGAVATQTQTPTPLLPTLVTSTAVPSATATITIEPSSNSQATNSPHAAAPAPKQAPTGQQAIGAAGLPRGQGAAPVRIVIPRIKLDTSVRIASWDLVDENGEQVSEWQIPYDAVGNLIISARPGEAGNAVISGHHNLIGPNTFGVGLFAGLWNLQAGDPVYVMDAAGRSFLYLVRSHTTVKELGEPLAVREEHARQLLADDGTPILSLETCWNGPDHPLSGNTYRWIVVARLYGSIPISQIPFQR